MSLEHLLNHHRFARHPFKHWIAEDEKEFYRWYVEPPFLRKFLGYSDSREPLSPRSSVIFGLPGTGKTALRLILEGEIHQKIPEALVIPYTDFTSPLDEGPVPSLASHIEEILLYGTIVFLDFLGSDEERFRRLDVTQKSELLGLISYYYERLRPHQRRDSLVRAAGVVTTGFSAFVRVYNTIIGALKREKIEASDWRIHRHDVPDTRRPVDRLARFWHLVKAAGVKSVWVLVDGIDEFKNVRTGVEIVDCVSSLLLNQKIMEFRDGEQVFCLKCFLSHPKEARERLKELRFRHDRIETYEIEWRVDDLSLALSKRLDFFSNGAVYTFDDLCVDSVSGVHRAIVKAASGRPRTVFRACHEIMSAFDRRGVEGEFRIDKNSIKVGLLAGLERKM